MENLIDGITFIIHQFYLYIVRLSIEYLTLLLIWVNKKNSMEFPLDFVYYIYTKSNPNLTTMSHTSLWVTFILDIHQ